MSQLTQAINALPIMKKKIRTEAEAMDMVLYSMGLGGAFHPIAPGYRNGDYRCITCKATLLPGKVARECKECRKKTEIKARLEYLRGEIEAECISYGEISELQDYAGHIEQDDVLLLQWAGVPEFPEEVVQEN